MRDCRCVTQLQHRPGTQNSKAGCEDADIGVQVIRLCWRFRLLTALTYILNRGLQDYLGPAAHLLAALLRAPKTPPQQQYYPAQPKGTLQQAQSLEDRAQSLQTQPSGQSNLLQDSNKQGYRAKGYRLLVYLRCCLTGQSFPPGQIPLHCFTSLLSA